MRYIHEAPGYSYAICDFCEHDSTGTQTKGKIFPLGEKGICLTCLKTMADLLAIAKAEGK